MSWGKRAEFSLGHVVVKELNRSMGRCLHRRQLEKQVWSSREKSGPEISTTCLGKLTMCH